ncbi:MAG: hypothetical protein AAF907_15220 [Planctomycetota bacterium]
MRADGHSDRSVESVFREIAALNRAAARLKPDWMRFLPPPLTDGAPHPTLKRRPRPPWVPQPPPHLDPDLSAEERQAAYEALLAAERAAAEGSAERTEHHPEDAAG